MLDVVIPEVVALGPNIFLESLPPPIQFGELPKALRRMPLDRAMARSMAPGYREFLLDTIEFLFVPTTPLLEPAYAVQSLLRRSLTHLNILDKSELIRTNQVGLIQHPDDLRKLPKLPGAGMILAGPTGTFKTCTVRRTLEVIVPQQCIEYAAGDTRGFAKLTQCVYLIVDHPSNGSRGGLLKRILAALDRALKKTNYFDQHKRSVNLDALLVVVAKLLNLHRVALLVIDEKQRQNFGESYYSVEFVLFYLSLMNQGISVALIGNPLAFVHLNMYSQVMRRFSIGGIHSLGAASLKSSWWQRDLYAGVNKFDLIDRWDVQPDQRVEIAARLTGRHPCLYPALHKETMRVALRRGGTEAVVTEQDYGEAAESPRYFEMMKFAKAVMKQDPESKLQYVDLHESPTLKPSGDQSAPPLAISDAAADMLKTLLKNFASQQTRSMNNVRKQLELAKTLSPDDVRMLGVTEEIVHQMEAAIAKFPAQAKPRKKAEKKADAGAAPAAS
jgi:hypothetical protein